ncbi:MAG: hypothetical protein ACRCS9_10620 [Hyphomicrobium sp.]
MLLGAVINGLKNETTALEALLSLGDIVLLAEVDAARQRHEESTSEYVYGAAQRFAQLASNDEWLQLTTALQKSDQPAETAVEIMVRWSIARDAQLGPESGDNVGCTCGGANGECH